MTPPALPDHIPTPVFVLDAARLRANLETAKRVREAAGCKILLATKAFSPAGGLSADDRLSGRHHGQRRTGSHYGA